MFSTPYRKAIFCVLLANFCFGINFSLVKIIGVGANGNEPLIGPFALNTIRVCTATILFWALYFIMPIKETIAKKDLGRFVLCAICGVILNQTLFIKGLVLTSTIHAAILILGTPIFITLIAWVVLKEKLTTLKITGFAIALFGAIFLALQKENAAVGYNILLGDILVLLNAIAYAIYFVIAKPLMQKYQPLTVIRTVFTIALPFMFALGYNQLQLITFNTWQPIHFMALFGAVIGATFIAYLCNAVALQNIGAARTGSFIYTQPIIATIIAVAFLGDTLSWQKGLAAVLIVAGVFCINKKVD
jgi:drug/metabolite transporter (DMT)-like permease